MRDFGDEVLHAITLRRGGGGGEDGGVVLVEEGGWSFLTTSQLVFWRFFLCGFGGGTQGEVRMVEV